MHETNTLHSVSKAKGGRKMRKVKRAIGMVVFAAMVAGVVGVPAYMVAQHDPSKWQPAGELLQVCTTGLNNGLPYCGSHINDVVD